MPSIFPWMPACWLRVQGPDAFDFLQGQFSNDLRPLLGSDTAVSSVASPGAVNENAGVPLMEKAPLVLQTQAAIYGLWLERRGRILGDGFVLPAGPECFFVCSYETPGEALLAHLQSFIVADEVELSNEAGSVAGLSLLDGAAELVATWPQAGLLFAGRRGACPGETVPAVPAPAALEWVGPSAAREALLAQLGQTQHLKFEAMEQRRIFAKIPAVPRDLGPDNLPQEGGTNFERDAISYTKGCYLGQEVMSRLHNKGRVRRQLVQLRVPASAAGPLPPLPCPLYSGGQKVGELRSAVRHHAAARSPALLGLALLSLPAQAQGAEPLNLSLNASA